MPLFVTQKCRVSHSLTPMSSAGDSNLPARIWLPKTLKRQLIVVVPEHFSTDKILDLKKWMLINQDENIGYEPACYSAWNGQPTLGVADVAKPEVCHVQVKVES